MTANKPVDYIYDATVLRIIDGDTIDVAIRWDIGFKIVAETKQRLRLAGINAPEVRGPERPAGLAATQWLAIHLPVGSTVKLQTLKDPDAFGRYIATLWHDDYPDKTLNDAMVEAGHAEWKRY